MATPSNDSDVPPPLPNSPPPLESANQRLDRLLMTTSGKSGNDDQPMITAVAPVKTGVLKNSINGDHTAVPSVDKSVKKVSWNDNPSTTVLPESDHSEAEHEEEEEEEDHQEDTFSLQDIDDVLGDQANSQTDWHSNYVTAGTTPGVIGSQEVYNDPRKRIEAARLKSNLANQTMPDKVPEKLTFAEKMKMFAKTSADNLEEDNNAMTRGKTKTSKAQRDIEERRGPSNGNGSMMNGDLNGRT